MHVDAVLFDFDDTLADSLPVRSAALQAVFDGAGLGDLSARSFFADLGGRALDVELEELAGSRGIAKTLFAAYAERYWTKPHEQTALFPGVPQMLTDLGNGYALGLVTNQTRSFVLDGVASGVSVELAALGLDGTFSVVVGYEDAGIAKPDPAGLVLAMERLGVTPGHTLYVGDSAADMAAANAAGCRSGHALWGIDEPGTGRASQLRPDAVFETPGEVVRYVRGSAQAGPASTRAK